MYILEKVKTFQKAGINRERNFRSFTDDCRILKFSLAMKGYSLQGHVLKTLTVQRDSTCEIRCFVEHGCVSYNIGPSHEDGSYVCELSDSDHEMHPEALARRNGFSYRATEVIKILESFTPPVRDTKRVRVFFLITNRSHINSTFLS